MKIIVLQDHLRNGGTERQSLLLSAAFAAAGHATTLVTCRPGGALAPLVDSAVTHHPLQPFDTRLDWFAPGLFGFAARLRPEAVLCMGRVANGFAGGLQKFLPSTAVIATMRTGKSLPWPYRRSLRLVRHVVANSHAAARVLTAQYAVASEKITVIPNALVFPPDLSDDRARATSSSSLRTAQGATAATVVLLCVAMFRPEKNQRALLGLAARLPRKGDWQLWFVGEGATQPACRALARQLGVADRVKFLGFQANPIPLYRAADVAVLTSQAESLPNFILEAQAHGLPVVADEVGGVRECFLPGETGWAVPAGNADTFLAALQPLLTDPALRARIAPVARTFARTAFSPARQTQCYLDLLHRLVPSHT